MKIKKMTCDAFKIIAILGFTIALAQWSGGAYAEALNTTSVGIGSRSIRWMPATDDSADGAAAKSITISESTSAPMICNRITTPSSIFTLELGASACMVTGGDRNFATSLSGHVMVLYYPFSARSKPTTNDSALRLRQISYTNVYIMGLGGFSKITRGDPITPVSYTVDNFDGGIGAGYSYRLFKHAAIGGEASYTHSSSLSPKVASGSASLISILGVVTVFL